MMKGLTGSLTYWGDQPGAYQGAVVVFLAILGFSLHGLNTDGGFSAHQC